MLGIQLNYHSKYLLEKVNTDGNRVDGPASKY